VGGLHGGQKSPVKGAGWRGAGLWVALALLGLASAGSAQDPALTFIGVALDADTARADEKLREYLRAKEGLKFEPRDMEYGAAIDTLVDWNVTERGPLIARVTPYVYVVAEMLGANLDILGTYASKRTQETTYQSYFVMHRAFGAKADDLDALVKLLRSRATPARFAYHNKFSTSSYLLPSLYFRRMGIYSGGLSNSPEQKLVFIRAEAPPGANESSDLVRLVKLRRYDIAAVWAGTQSKFADDPDLRFIKLPNILPNDLLVFAPTPNRQLRERIVAALRQMQDSDINVGDFQKWHDFNATPEARRALAALRRMTRVTPTPVPIKIRGDHAPGNELDPRILDTARQAVPLSGTEFVLFDEDFHKQFDVLWTLRRSHDDSIIITSEYPDFKLPPQQFHISYKKGDRESLVARIEEQISNGMHRVRDIWSYDDEVPTVLRDVRFALPVGTQARAVKFTWNDFTNNDRVVGTPFDVTVAASDFHSFKFRGEGFPKRSDGIHLDFDPLSNTVHRVILIRPTADTRLFRAGTYLLVGLLSLAALFALWSLVREGGNARPVRPAPGGPNRPAPEGVGAES
jgi:ABC-type phosphate/phosphonate transport system substrate-binding protein